MFLIGCGWKKKTLERLHERRKQVVRLHKKGIKIMQIVDMTGLSYPPVRAAIDLYEAGRWSAIRAGASAAMVECSVRCKKRRSSA